MPDELPPLDESVIAAMANRFFQLLPGDPPPDAFPAPHIPGADLPATHVPQTHAPQANVPEVHVPATHVPEVPSPGTPGPVPGTAVAPVRPSAPPTAPFGAGVPATPAGRDPAAFGPAGDYYFLSFARPPAPADPQVPAGFASRPGRTPVPRPEILDVQAVRRDFPILAERVNGRPLVWFDNAATTQKPRAVIDRLVRFYTTENSNIHRAAHELAARATDAYEDARATVTRFLGAPSTDGIVFVRGATEAINLVAKAWGPDNIGEGDEIVVSHLEHHANIVPWQQLAATTGAVLRVIPVDDDGQLRLDSYVDLLGPRTKLVAVAQVSNALGTITPVREVIAAAHAVGARVLVDGAQSVSHLRVNLTELDADFFAFSGHKVFGPTGIGVLYGKPAILEQMAPWQGGGNMIADVTFEHTVYQDPPARFEAGTGNIADAVGLGAALSYLESVGLERVAAYEHELLDYLTAGLCTVPGLRIIGTAPTKASVASFVIDGYRPDEIGKALNQEGIAVRTGHHCAQPILRRFGVEATVRPSLALYNTRDEVDLLVNTLHRFVGTRRSAAVPSRPPRLSPARRAPH